MSNPWLGMQLEDVLELTIRERVLGHSIFFLLPRANRKPLVAHGRFDSTFTREDMFKSLKSGWDTYLTKRRTKHKNDLAND